MRQTRRLRIAAVCLSTIGVFVIACLAGSVPKITYIRTCTDVLERPSQFEASGWTMRFNVGDAVYCVVRVDVPHDASRSSYDGTIRWYAPNGDLYYEHDYKNLARGYIWSLWGSIDEADIAGEWRVTFSLRYAASRSVLFTVSGTSSTDGSLFNPPSIDYQQPSLDLPSLQGTPPSSVPPSEPVAGREEEPNETSQTANLLRLDEGVQGEVRFYSNEVYDQDWFRINLESDRKYWLVINAVGTTSQWLSPASFLRLYKGDRLNDPLSFSSYSRQERGKERSTCDLVVPLQGPATYCILISAQDCEHDVIYSLQVATTEPEWVEE